MEIIDPIMQMDMATSSYPWFFFLSLCFLRELEVGTKEALIKIDKSVTETGSSMCKKTRSFLSEGMMGSEDRWGSILF